MSVTATVSGSTAAVQRPSASQLEKIISESTHTGEITIDVSGLGKNVTTASIPTETIKAVEKAVNPISVSYTPIYRQNKSVLRESDTYYFADNGVYYPHNTMREARQVDHRSVAETAKLWGVSERGYLRDTCLTAQDVFRETMKYFRIEC